MNTAIDHIQLLGLIASSTTLSDDTIGDLVRATFGYELKSVARCWRDAGMRGLAVLRRIHDMPGEMQTVLVLGFLFIFGAIVAFSVGATVTVAFLLLGVALGILITVTAWNLSRIAASTR